ncbi:MAG: phosphoenolpyruvate synthase [Candidatus Kerfeldbacteria bacterium]|nr:phosphoenolpyruvate synthase [Candidatus Kerfeldbacteria bacterium]
MKECRPLYWFDEVRREDVAAVGGKNASLGELYQQLSKQGVLVPYGFAISASAYEQFIDGAGIRAAIEKELSAIDTHDIENLAHHGHRIREMIIHAQFPEELKKEIVAAYEKLSEHAGVLDVDVAVRSSATAEDLPDASFAGQQETYLNIRGGSDLLLAVKKCMASLFTNRAISYRADKNFDHFSVSLSVGVQIMVRSDIASSGVMFTLDPETGYRDAVIITGAYGLGELVVQGKVDPDEFIVSKHTAEDLRFRPIVSRRLGTKKMKMVYAPEGEIDVHGTVKEIPVEDSAAHRFILSDDEVLKLGRWAMLIERHYGMPMDIEWAKDGKTGELYVVQARPETVRSQHSASTMETYHIDSERSAVVVSGVAVGTKIGSGKARVIRDVSQMHEFKAGEVLVTEITDPDWEPIMKIASGIVTNSGGRTSHAAIVSRELGIPAIVGTHTATERIKMGDPITVSCAEGERGMVYAGELKFSIDSVDFTHIPQPRTHMMMIVADPSRVFEHAMIPNSGVGLAREELIILNHIKIHPLALLHPEKVTDAREQKLIASMTRGYASPKEYFVRTLAEGIGKIAAAYYPNDVIVRTSDFKSNEYAKLIGGSAFEPHEENPMIGWRGASRYYSEEYEEAFVMECEALRIVREEMGMTNMKIMIPFCRTPEEGRKVVALMNQHGLVQGKDGLEFYVMCEIPANVILAKEFAQIFDGFSIGSNDLTQLTLGLDRDSGLVAHLYDERNEAVKTMIAQAITTVHAQGKKIGICGQAPSDFPEFAEFLVDCGIDSIALNPDAVVSTTLAVAKYEQTKK